MFIVHFFDIIDKFMDGRLLRLLLRLENLRDLYLVAVDYYYYYYCYYYFVDNLKRDNADYYLYYYCYSCCYC